MVLEKNIKNKMDG